MDNIENKNMVELSEESLEEIAGGKGGKGQQVKATGDVYVRKGPDRDYAEIGLLYTGDKVPYLGERKRDYRGVAWYRVSYKGRKGWVSSKYSKIV